MTFLKQNFTTNWNDKNHTSSLALPYKSTSERMLLYIWKLKKLKFYCLMAINCFIFIHIRYLYKLSDVYSSHDYRLVFDVSSLMPQDTCRFLIVVIPNPISFLWHFLHYAKYKHFSYKKCYLYDSWISFLQQNKQIMFFF